MQENVTDARKTLDSDTLRLLNLGDNQQELVADLSGLSSQELLTTVARNIQILIQAFDDFDLPGKIQVLAIVTSYSVAITAKITSENEARVKRFTSKLSVPITIMEVEIAVEKERLQARQVAAALPAETTSETQKTFEDVIRKLKEQNDRLSGTAPVKPPPAEQPAVPETLIPPRFTVRVGGHSIRGEYAEGGHSVNEDTYYADGNNNFAERHGQLSKRTRDSRGRSLSTLTFLPNIPTELHPTIVLFALGDGVSQLAADIGSRYVVGESMISASKSARKSNAVLSRSEWLQAFSVANETLFADYGHYRCLNPNCDQTKHLSHNRRKLSEATLTIKNNQAICASCGNNATPEASNLIAAALDLAAGKLSYAAVSDPVGFVAKADNSIRELHDERAGYRTQLGSGRSFTEQSLKTGETQVEAGDLVLLMSDGPHNECLAVELKIWEKSRRKQAEIVSNYLFPAEKKPPSIDNRYKLLSAADVRIIDEFYASAHQKIVTRIKSKMAKGKSVQEATEAVLLELRESCLADSPGDVDDFTLVVISVDDVDTEPPSLSTLEDVMTSLQYLSPEEMLPGIPNAQKVGVVLKDLTHLLARLSLGYFTEITTPRRAIPVSINLDGQIIPVRQMLIDLAATVETAVSSPPKTSASPASVWGRSGVVEAGQSQRGLADFRNALRIFAEKSGLPQFSKSAEELANRIELTAVTLFESFAIALLDKTSDQSAALSERAAAARLLASDGLIPPFPSESVSAIRTNIAAIFDRLNSTLHAVLQAPEDADVLFSHIEALRSLLPLLPALGKYTAATLEVQLSELSKMTEIKQLLEVTGPTKALATKLASIKYQHLGTLKRSFLRLNQQQSDRLNSVQEK